MRDNLHKKRLRMFETSNRCALCGHFLLFNWSSCDHVIARMWGGTNAAENLQLLCHRCNRFKGCDPLESFVCPLEGGPVQYVWDLILQESCTMPAPRVIFNYDAVKNEAKRTLARDCAAKIHTMLKRTTADIIAIGRNLIEVHDAIGAGCYQAWLRAEFRWSQGTASNFETITRKFGELACVDNFQPAALTALCRKSISPKTVKKAIDLAERGEMVTGRVVRQLMQRELATSQAPRDATLPALLMKPIQDIRCAVRQLMKLPGAQRMQFSDELLELAMQLRKDAAAAGQMIEPRHVEAKPAPARTGTRTAKKKDAA
jgi:hypothetical protein